jgi:hypothetical protein
MFSVSLYDASELDFPFASVCFVKAMLSCYFGHEMEPNGAPFTPVIPPKSSLVITQCCISATCPTGGAVTLYVQPHDLPSKLAVCTLHPDADVFHCPVQLIFSKPFSLYLEPHTKKSAKNGNDRKKKSPDDESDRSFPRVHLSGYYECDIEESDGDEESETDSSSAEETEEVAMQRPQRGGYRTRRPQGE